MVSGTHAAYDPTLAVHGLLLNRTPEPYGAADPTARVQRVIDCAPPIRPEPAGADTGPVTRRWLVGAGIWAVGAAVAFALLPVILAAFVVILGATAVVVAVLSADWREQPTFEQRELVRARKRAEKR